MHLIFDNIELSPFEDEGSLGEQIQHVFHIPSPFPYDILRKSLDARDKGRIVYRYRVRADLPDALAQLLLKAKDVSLWHASRDIPAQFQGCEGLKVLIVGAGPAGLFCALRLIEAGGSVLILERGVPVEERLRDIELLQHIGSLNRESNVLFGEGGAGTYSDGKLMTRIHRPEVAWFFKKMVDLSAPRSILYEQRPHIGTDRLVPIIREIRNRIEAAGSRILFHEKIFDIITHKETVMGVITEKGNEYHAPYTVLATGHSARDVYEILRRKGIRLEKKGFAIGLRVEHPAELINTIQYGRFARQHVLPPAEYSLRFYNEKTGRSVFSFCMCPGGEVINASSEEGRLCINGMSCSRRDSPYSNAALIVTIGDGDLPEDPLAGIAFQREMEEGAYAAGGEGYCAPAQRIPSFLFDALDTSLPPVSYQPRVRPAQHTYLPSWLAAELKIALQHFETKMKGFISNEGVLIGVETRTSSPVRIPRGADYQSLSVRRLLPVGEGAGYAGGIVSAAVDGIRTADKICEDFQERQ